MLCEHSYFNNNDIILLMMMANSSIQQASEVVPPTVESNVAPTLLDSISKNANKKRVSFCETVQVMLIPCIQEYRDARLMDLIWWNVNDHKYFQLSLSHSFKKYLVKFPCENMKQALRLFIQAELLLEESNDDFQQHDAGFKRSVSVEKAFSEPMLKKIKT